MAHALRTLASILATALLGPALLLAQTGGGTTPDTTAPALPAGPYHVFGMVEWHVGHTDRTVQLEWRMAVEHDLLRFVVERSRDGEPFVPVAEVPSAGSPMEGHHYQLLDSPPTTGVHYYRLRAERGSGAHQTSTLMPVHLTYALNEMVLYPCPARDVLHVGMERDAQPVRYAVYGRRGTLLQEGILQGEEERIDITRLPSGNHLLLMMDAEGRVLGRSNWMKE